MRLIHKAVDILRQGGLVIYPTDTVYGLGCSLFNKKGIEKIYDIKKQDRKQPFSFICADLKDISRYAIVSDFAYKTMKRLLPDLIPLFLRLRGSCPKSSFPKERRPVSGFRRMPSAWLWWEPWVNLSSARA
jgi:tRNA threonylcarbamoyl adenosine modification protein (Sua5/YciO/YrdC/YwlC family)